MIVEGGHIGVIWRLQTQKESHDSNACELLIAGDQVMEQACKCFGRSRPGPGFMAYRDER